MLRNHALPPSSPSRRGSRWLLVLAAFAMPAGHLAAAPSTDAAQSLAAPGAAEPAAGGDPAPTAAPDLAVRNAVAAGDSAALRKALAAGGRAEQAGKMGVTLLMNAAEHGQAEIVELLLAAGAAVDRATSWNETVLGAAARGGNPRVVASLLAAGADVNHRAKLGFSPLIVAIGSGQLEIVRQLLAAGADPNQAAVGGTPPLQFAAAQGRIEITRALLAAGARLETRDEFGRDVLALAVDGGHEDMIAFLEQATGRKAVRPPLAQAGSAAMEVGEVDFQRFSYHLEGRAVEVRDGLREAAGPNDFAVESTSAVLGDLGGDGQREAAILLRYSPPGGALAAAVLVFGVRDGKLVEVGRLPQASAGQGAVLSIGIAAQRLLIVRQSPAAGQTTEHWRLADSGLAPVTEQ